MTLTAEQRYINGEYLAANPTWGTEDGIWKAQMIRRLWQQTRLPFPQTVAEIGCGAGGILAELHSLHPGTTYSGFDIAPEAIQMADKFTKPGLSYHCEDLTGSSRTFDALLCIDVFEHVENPFEFLRNIRKLAPLLIFNIPLEMHVAGLLINHQLWTRRHYGHLHFYTAAVALQTLKECGYSIVSQSYISRLTALPRTISEYIFWLPRKLTALFSSELSARLFGGTSLLVVARTDQL